MRTRALCFFPAVVLASSALQAAPVHQWSQRFGDADQQQVESVAVDGLGNVVITGYFYGSVDFGGGSLTSAGNDDIFVAKFDATGSHLWSHRFGDSALDVTPTQIGRSVAVDGSGNVVITGYFYGSADFGGGLLTSAGSDDILVAKFDANGNHIWSKLFGDVTKNQFGYSIAVDGSGNVVLTGYFYGSVDFGGGPLVSAGNEDIFVTKFDANGSHIWSRRFGDDYSQGGYSVAVDGSDNVVVTGYLYGSADFGGGQLTSAGSDDIFVAKFDANGNHIWSQRFGDASELQWGHSIAVDGPGNVVVTGHFYGSVDFGGGPLTSTGDFDIYVATFDADGNHLWSQRFGDADYPQFAGSVAADGLGNVVLTGSFTGTVDFGGGPLTGAGDVFIAKFDGNGSHLWSQRFGDGEGQEGASVAADGSGNVVVAGLFGGTVDFGGGPLTSAGNFDIFIAKFADAPNPVLITSFKAVSQLGAVEVTWDVWSDEALESFALYRRDDARQQAIEIAEGPFNPTTRSYVDASVEPGRTYHYELLIRTRDGDDIRSPVATVTVPALKATLGQNFPNPFKPATTIEYTLSEQSSAVVGIYNAAGRLVVRLDQGVHDAGTHRAEWDGRDASGRAVGSGVYFYRLEGAPSVPSKKMVLIK